MEIININPRGYCYGVVDAMVIAKNAALDTSLPRPIYILGMIVHNQHITDAFEAIGIHTLDGNNREEILAQVDSGTVIFTAHGTSPQVMKKAKEKGLTTIDASCPDVMITHEIIREKVAAGFEILYIGKKGHPEPEGAIGVAPTKVHLISSLEDLETFETMNSKLFVTNQTTMSQWDVEKIMAAVKKKFPSIHLHKDICKATQVRQEAVAEQAKGCDLTIVVGDPRSNNSNRLAQVSIEQACVPAYRIADVSELDGSWLVDVKKIAITAGASTPTQLVREVLLYLENYDPLNQETWQTTSSIQSENILPRGRFKNIEPQRQKRLEKLRHAGKERI